MSFVRSFFAFIPFANINAKKVANVLLIDTFAPALVRNNRHCGSAIKREPG